jgi:hypothetical protein
MLPTRRSPAIMAAQSRFLSCPCPTQIRRGVQDDPVAVAREVIERLQAVYAIEAEIRGSSAEQRLTARRSRTAPLMEALSTRLMATVGSSPSRS